MTKALTVLLVSVGCQCGVFYYVEPHFGDRSYEKLGSMTVLRYLIILTLYKIISLTILAYLVLFISHKSKCLTTATVITLAAFAQTIVIFLTDEDFVQLDML